MQALRLRTVLGMYAKGPLLLCTIFDKWVGEGDLEGLDLTYEEKDDAAQVHL